MTASNVITRARTNWYLRDLAQETRAATNCLHMLNMPDKDIAKLPFELLTKREGLIELLSNASNFEDFKEVVRATSADAVEILQFNNEEESNDRS